MNSVLRAAPIPYLVVLVALLLAACTASDKTRSVYYDDSADLRGMVPLHERGVETLGMIYRPYEKVGLRYHGAPLVIAFVKVRLRTELHEVEAETLVPRQFVEERLLAEAKLAPHVEARLLTPEEAGFLDHMKDSGFYDERSFDETGKQMLAALKTGGIDAVLVVEEPESWPDFMSASTYSLPSKGLWYGVNEGVHSLAGFRFFLIDTATGLEMENTAFNQVSAEPIDIRKWKGPLEAYSPIEQDYIKGNIRLRVANNLKVMLQILKVIPGEDGTFLTEE